MVVGAIGPWELGDKASQNWLRNTIRSWLARWDVSLGYTDLEPGTGILFAEVLAEAGIPYRVILPSERIFVQISSRHRFNILCRQAAALHHLGEDDSADWALARRHLVEQCDVVLSILCGNPTSDAEFLAIQSAACQSKIAVVSLNLFTKTATVVCKNNQL